MRMESSAIYNAIKAWMTLWMMSIANVECQDIDIDVVIANVLMAATH